MSSHKIDTLDLAIHLLEDERRTNLGRRKYLFEKNRQKLRKSKDYQILNRSQSKGSLKQQSGKKPEGNGCESGYNTNRSIAISNDSDSDSVKNAENNQLTKSQSLGTLTTIGKTKFASETRKADFFSRKLSVRSVNSTITRQSVAAIPDNITPVRTPSPTVSEFQIDTFDASRCARLLFKLKRGRDCVDDVLMETLGIRTYSQRALVIKCFGKLYEIELETWLVNIVKSDFHALVKALTTNQEQKLAEELHIMLSDPDSNVSRIVETITLHNGIALNELKSTYFERFGKTLEKTLVEAFTEPTSLFLAQLCQEDSRGLTQKLGLFDQQGATDNLNELNNDNLKFINVLGNSYQHLKSVLAKHYKNLSGDHDSAIFTEAVDTFISCVWSPHSLYVKRIYSNLSTDNSELLGTIVARASVDMEAICLAYKRQYKVELTESIRLHYMNDAGPLIVNIILYFTQSDVKNLHESRFSNMDKYRITSIDDAHPEYLEQIIYHSDTKGSKEQQRNMWKFLNDAEKSKYMEMLSKEADLKMLQMTDLPDKQPIDAQEIEHNCSQSKYHISCTDERCKQHGEKSFWKISWTNYDKLIYKGTVRNHPSFVLSHCVHMLRLSIDISSEEQFIESWIASSNNRSTVKTEFERQQKLFLNQAIQKAYKEPQSVVFQLMFEQPSSLDVWVLNEAFSSGSTLSLEIFLIIMECRSPQEIKAIESKCIKTYGIQLKSQLTQIANGQTYQLLEMMLTQPRDFIGKPVDSQICWSEATRLFKDSKKPLDLNVSLLIEILSRRNKFHIATVAKEYHKITGHSLEVAFKKFSDPSFRYSLESITKLLLDPLKFFVPLLKKFFEDRNTFIQFIWYIIVSRCEVDLLSIAELFKSEYQRNLMEEFKICLNDKFAVLSKLLVIG